MKIGLARSYTLESWSSRLLSIKNKRDVLEKWQTMNEVYDAYHNVDFENDLVFLQHEKKSFIRDFICKVISHSIEHFKNMQVTVFSIFL